MRILFLCQYYYPEKIFVQHITEALTKDGHEVTVLCQTPNYGYGKTLEGYENGKTEKINGVRVIRLKTYPRKKGKLSLIHNYFSFQHAANNWARKTNEVFDVIYAWSLSPVLYLSAGKILKKRYKIPYVVHVLDCWPASIYAVLHKKEKGLSRYFLKKWFASYYNSADYMYVSSPSFLTYLEEVCGKKHPPMEYLPQPYGEIKEKPYPLEKKTHSFLYAGNVGALQLVPNLIEAFAALKNKDVDFHIFGNGKMLEEAKKVAKENALEEQVHFHSAVSQEEIFFIAKKMDAVFVSLKSSDSIVSSTIPLKCITSLTYGIPVIGVLEGDGKRVLEEAGGCFTSLANKEDIVKNMEKVLTLSKEEKEMMGEKNIAYAKKNFSLQHFMNTLEERFLTLRK